LLLPLLLPLVLCLLMLKWHTMQSALHGWHQATCWHHDVVVLLHLLLQG
jgi:hypothetical protein